MPLIANNQQQSFKNTPAYNVLNRIINNNNPTQSDQSTNDVFNIYTKKIVLQRTQPETWESSNNTQEPNVNKFTSTYSSQPTNKVQTNNQRTTNLGISNVSEAWSNLSDTITDKNDHDLPSGTYLSISERKPSMNLTHSSCNFSDIHKESVSESSSSEESLKSFEMNELLNDISDDSINNEILENSDNSMKDFKNLEKIVSDSGYMTVPPNSSSRLGNSSNEDEVNNSFFIDQSSFNEEKCLLRKVNENQSEELTKVTSLIDGYDSDNSCANLSEQFSGSNNVITNLLKELVSEVTSINEIEDEIDNNNNNHDEKVSLIKVNQCSNQDNQNFNTVVNDNNNSNNHIKKEISTSDDQELLKMAENSSGVNNREHRSNLRRRRSLRDSEFNEPAADSGITKLSKNRILTSLSPLKKKVKRTFKQSIADNPEDSDDKMSLTGELNIYNEGEGDDEDEFFLAITTDQLETGSCPDFFWYTDLGKFHEFIFFPTIIFT